jgi:hypothetical protein
LPRRRSARSWDRNDAVLALAAYFDKPPRSALPSLAERQKIANLTGQDIAEVTRRCSMYAALDPNNPSEGVPPTERETRLWADHATDRLALMLEAQAILEGKRRVPPALRGP